MLVIRFFRTGKKNQPSFKIIVTDKRRSSTGGRFVEEVGFWNPLTKEKVLKKERILYWISVGAQPSKSIHNLLIAEKIVEGKKIPKHKKPKKKEEKPLKEKVSENKEKKPTTAEAPVSKKEKPVPEKIPEEKKTE